MGADVTASRVFFDLFITSIFITVAAMLLFPMNSILPIDRRLASMLGAVLCTVFLYAFPTESDNLNPGTEVDFNVLIILTAIMAINYVLLRQPYVLKLTKTTQALIKQDVRKGFLAVSVIALLASPLITNDGLCLMLVHPVLDAFVDEDDDNENGKYIDNNDKHNVNRNANKDDAKSIAPTDKFYFMLAIACSANIGSAMTYCGNPQNIIVATYLSRYMNGGQFFGLMFIPSILSWVITMTVLNYFRVDAANQYRKNAKESKDAFTPLTMDYDRSTHNIENNSKERDEDTVDNVVVMKSVVTIDNHKDTDEESSCYDSTAKEQSIGRRNKPTSSNNNNIIQQTYNPLINGNDVESHNSTKYDDNNQMDSNSNKYHHTTDSIIIAENDPFSLPIVVFPWIILLVIFEFTGVFPLAGLYAVLSVLLIVIVILVNFYYYNYYQDYIDKTDSNNNNTTTINDTNAQTMKENNTKLRLQRISQIIEGLFHEIDYNLLIIFIGLFIVSGSFLKTQIPVAIWNGLSGSKPFMTPGSLIVLSIYIIVASQLVGNVPVVFMAKDQIIELDRRPQIFGWLILAFVSTIAGNFTLVGSAANIIVVEKAMRHKKCPVKIDAFPHFKHCGLVTIVCIVVGVMFLYLECLV